MARSVHIIRANANWSLLRGAVFVQGEPAPYPTFGGTACVNLEGSI